MPARTDRRWWCFARRDRRRRWPARHRSARRRPNWHGAARRASDRRRGLCRTTCRTRHRPWHRETGRPAGCPTPRWRQILVEAGLEADVVLLEQRLGLPQRAVVGAERRAAIAGDEARGVQACGAVARALHERQAHQRLNPREIYASGLEGVFVLQAHARQVHQSVSRPRLNRADGTLCHGGGRFEERKYARRAILAPFAVRMIQLGVGLNGARRRKTTCNPVHWRGGDCADRAHERYRVAARRGHPKRLRCRDWRPAYRPIRPKRAW